MFTFQLMSQDCLTPHVLWQLVQYLVRLTGFHDVFLNESVNRPSYFFLWQLVQFLVRLIGFYDVSLNESVNGPHTSSKINNCQYLLGKNEYHHHYIYAIF